MKKTFTFLIAALIFVSCANYAGGNGSSPSKAVKINEDERQEGKELMNDWLKREFPGSDVLEQSIFLYEGDIHYKVMIKTSGGAVMPRYFDVSDFMELERKFD